MTRRRWGHRLKRSLGMRLVLLFLLLALATTAIFLAGMQRALSGGWSTVLRPLVADYVDRLAARPGFAARRGARPGAGAAAAAVGAHRRTAGAVRLAPAAARLASRAGPKTTTGPLAAAAPVGRRPPHHLRPGRPRLGVATAHHRLVHAGGAAAAHRRRLRLCAPPVQAAGRHPQRRAALRPGAVRPADPRAAPGRAGRTGRAGQHHGPRYPRACSKPSAACCWR